MQQLIAPCSLQMHTMHKYDDNRTPVQKVLRKFTKLHTTKLVNVFWNTDNLNRMKKC